MMERIELRKGCNLLVTEGTDALKFFIQALQVYKFENIQVVNYGGIKDLTAYLKLLKNLAGFEEITKILIIRDAETDADAAERSICSSLLNSGGTAPSKAGVYEGGLPEIAYYLFPGTRTDDRYDNGTLVTDYKGAKEVEQNGAVLHLNGERDADAPNYITLSEPTGISIREYNKKNYAIAIVISGIILAAGIVIIKKKIIK